MSLREYHRKRHFGKTSEPKGKERSQGDHHAFVVQKHAASHLHYDFRLEMDGVLKSWAVPKGPSLTPATKRLAMQVEDHPLEYGDFEGTIPAGEYGGGTVMLWDRGTWKPLDDPHEAMQRGRLKFQLDGEKLKGNWMLLRIGGRNGKDDSKKPQWLLMKERDDEARTADDPEITEEAPLSVKTHRDMNAIAGGDGPVWTSKGRQKKSARPKKKHGTVKVAAKKRSKKKSAKKRKPADLDLNDIAGTHKGKLSKTFEPQLATLADDAPTGDDWLHEIKFDGYRILCRIQGAEVKLFSRSQQDWTRKLPHLVSAAKDLGLDEVLFDGEVVALQEDGTSNFQSLQNAFRDGRSGELVYYVFDLLHLNGYDLTSVSLEDRKQVLKQLLQGNTDEGIIRYSEHVVGGGEGFHTEACRLGLEGMISKRRDRPYHPGRSYDWIKIKCQRREEFVIGGFTEPSGSRADFGALLVGYFNRQGDFIYAGKVGTGYTQKTLRELGRQMQPLEQEVSPFRNLTSRTGPARTAHWLKPKLVAQVQFSNWTDDEKLRHPSFQGLREDKPAKEVVRESPVPLKRILKSESPRVTSKMKTKSRQPKATRSRSASNSDSNHAGREETTIAGVRLTHPDKVLYPEAGITKLQLAQYYEMVADWILPHVAHRPAVLVRCPEGYKKQCFFQKHFDTDPSGMLRLFPVTEKSSTRNYAVIKDVQGLIALAQMGVLEIHVWGSQIDKLEQPDRLIFDLDPDPSVDWSVVVESARQIREFLADLGLETFVKTTGGKGVHLVAPIQRRHDWDEVRAFCEAVARAIVTADPQRYTANMSKKARPGKIFIDYLRNARGATAVAAYSTRARAGAPVSMPLDWKELSAKTPSNHFTIENAPRRMQSLKRDPWSEMASAKQSITAAAIKQVQA